MKWLKINHDDDDDDYDYDDKFKDIWIENQVA